MGFAPGPGGGSSSIAGSTDVSLDNPQNDQPLIYSSVSSKWQNVSAIGPVQIAGVLSPDDPVPNDGKYYLQLDSMAGGDPEVTYIGSYTTTSDSTGGTIDLTQNVEAGAVLVITLHGGGTETTMTASDAASNSWLHSSVSSTSASPHSTTRIARAVVTNPLSSGQTITVSRSSNGGLVAHLAVIRSVVGTAGDTGIGDGSSNTVIFSPVDAQAKSVVISAATTTANITFTAVGGGATVAGQAASRGGSQARTGAMLYQTRASAGNVSHTIGMSANMQQPHATLEIR